MRLKLLFAPAAAVLLGAQAMASVPLELVVSIRHQTMTVLREGARQAEFRVSTSKFGLGDEPRSFHTPLGHFCIDRKIGGNLPAGAVFKALHFTGEVISPNTPGRDPIVTRVLCLRGVENRNGHAAARGIYIHGTPEEKTIGKPASYGCIRMRSRDVITLFDSVDIGTRVLITDVPAAAASSLSGMADAHGDDWFR